MPIPFNDLAEDSDLGLAAFLRFEEEPNRRGMRGALFLVTSRGVPVEFSFTRIDVAASFLWRAGDARRHAIANLSKVLFEACSRQPDLILALADEVAPQVFTEDLHVGIPICRVSSLGANTHATTEVSENLSDTPGLFWVDEQPDAGSSTCQLLEALRLRQLLTEPFERASVGLEEAFNDS